MAANVNGRASRRLFAEPDPRVAIGHGEPERTTQPPNDLRGDWTAEQRQFYEADRNLDVACQWLDSEFPEFRHVTLLIQHLLWESARVCSQVSAKLRSNDPKEMKAYLALQRERTAEQDLRFCARQMALLSEAMLACEEELAFLENRLIEFDNASWAVVKHTLENWDPIPALLLKHRLERVPPKPSQNWWYEPGDPRPPEFTFGPLIGTKTEIGRWMGEKETPNSRRLEQKAKQGIVAAVRIDRTVWEIWFKDERSWERVASAARNQGARVGGNRFSGR